MSSENPDVGPVIKWAGGKRRLLPTILPRLCSRTPIRHYFEPFIGGGAVFFELARLGLFREATIGDANPELVVLYTAVRDHVGRVIERLSDHQKCHATDYWWTIRDAQPVGAAARALLSLDPGELAIVAARTIYLNKACFNGLYRRSSEGKFNVPMGKYLKPNILDEAGLRAASVALQGVHILHFDFEATVANAGPGDAVYFDPPYLAVSESSSFSGYVYNPFSMSDHRRLASVFTALGKRGVTAVLSNSSTPETRVLFGAPHDLTLIKVNRSINSDGEGRGAVDEILSVASQL